MKTRSNLLLFSVLILILLAGCRATTELQVLQPADIGMPDHLEVLVTVDRAQPAKGFNNVMEGLLTGEDIGQDRRGRRRALDGLTDALTRTPRFSVRSSGLELAGSNAGDRFAPPLDWEEVDRICRQYGADALLCIEMYDTDNFLSTFERERKKKDKNDQQVIEKYFESELDVSVKIGWRLYDPRERLILDEFTVRTADEVSATGPTEDQAKGNLPDREAITQRVSHLAGERYGMRIAPVWITVQREWYQKGKGRAKEQMEQAARYAKAGEWERAAGIWRALASPASDPRTAGRAAYNMAVANERAGKLQSALDWARRAYTDFGNKKGSTYAQVLEMRMEEQERAEEQLDG